MAPPSTFERVYAALKQQLRAGAFRPGDRLEPAALSGDLLASVTPIRDALHRLTGERLVDAPPHEGFRVPLPSETMIRHLYAWHLDLLLLALARQSHVRGDAAATAEPARLDSVLTSLAARSGNPEHVSALRNIRDRLGPFERFEARLLDDLQPEIDAIAAAFAAGDFKALRRHLVAYHRRRNRLVPELLALALDPDNNRAISPE